MFGVIIREDCFSCYCVAGESLKAARRQTIVADSNLAVTHSISFPLLYSAGF